MLIFAALVALVTIFVSFIWVVDLLVLLSEFSLYETPGFFSFRSQLFCFLFVFVAFIVWFLTWKWYCLAFGFGSSVGWCLVVVISSFGLTIENQEGLVDLSDFVSVLPDMGLFCKEWALTTLTLCGIARGFRLLPLKLSRWGMYMYVGVVVFFFFGWFVYFYGLYLLGDVIRSQLHLCVKGIFSCYPPS